MSRYIKEASDALSGGGEFKSRYIKEKPTRKKAAASFAVDIEYEFSLPMKFLVLFMSVMPYIIAFTSGTNIGISLSIGTVGPAFYLLSSVLFFILKKDISLKDYPKIKKFIIPYAVIASTLLLTSAINLTAFYSCKYFVSVLSIITFCYIGYDVKALRLCGYANGLIALVLITDYTIGGITAGWNPNSMGILVTIGIFWMFCTHAINGKKFIVFDFSLIGIIVVLKLATDCRSVIVGLVICLLLNICMPKKFIMSKKLYRTFYSVMLAIPAVIISVITMLYAMPVADDLDRISLEYTGKLFFSGREEIWLNAIKNNTNPLFGFGMEFPGNAHNLYMNLYYCFGIVGIIAYLFLLVKVLEYLHNYFEDRIVRCCVYMFLSAFLIHSFEAITANIGTNNIIPYMFLAVAIGRTIIIQRREAKTDETVGNTSGI